MPTVAENSNIQPPYIDEARKPLTSWWGVGSLSFGGLAAAFLPAAYIGGGDWTGMLYNIFPMWCLCALIGVACGIRGMTGRRLTAAQRLLAAGGTLLSLGAFVVLTLVAMIGGA